MMGRTPTLFLVAFLALFAATSSSAASAASSASSAAGDREEFFVLSSVDSARGRMVLKRPTEVTVLMQVTGQTAYRDEQGKTLRLSDLRTGDTLFITFRQIPAGAPIALRIRLGPMTLQEMRRYLKPGAS
jgi:hypothetical protein